MIAGNKANVVASRKASFCSAQKRHQMLCVCVFLIQLWLEGSDADGYLYKSGFGAGRKGWWAEDQMLLFVCIPSCQGGEGHFSQLIFGPEQLWPVGSRHFKSQVPLNSLRLAFLLLKLRGDALSICCGLGLPSLVHWDPFTCAWSNKPPLISRCAKKEGKSNTQTSFPNLLFLWYLHRHFSFGKWGATRVSCITFGFWRPVCKA